MKNMEQDLEQFKNVVDYIFYIMPIATKDFTQKPTNEELHFIYVAAQKIYIQCIAKELERYEQFKQKGESK